jgi:hypothetical protein
MKNNFNRIIKKKKKRKKKKERKKERNPTFCCNFQRYNRGSQWIPTTLWHILPSSSAMKFDAEFFFLTLVSTCQMTNVVAQRQQYKTSEL